VLRAVAGIAFTVDAIRASRHYSDKRPPTLIELIIGVVVNFFDALVIDNYAPCMVTLALFGMNPLAAFPIMMGSCALLQPIASLRFFETGRFGWGTCVGLSIGGIAHVLIAAYLVKSLPLVTLRWLVTFVIAYAAFAKLRSAATEPRLLVPA
jgi:hypothetical protein